VLVATSVPMQAAVMAARRARRGAALAALAVALFVQAGYFAMQVHQYADDLTKFTPQQNAYASLYYTLLGADHAHVAVGLLLDLFLLTKLVGGFTPYRVRAVQVVAFYWHAVNLITLAITLAVLSPAV
jgi:heme/copper-type cytochrome/quinol oxidase subunit 3